MDHPIVLVSVMLYGDPTREESFARAWRRALDRLGLSGEPDDMLLDRLRARVIQGLPGRNEAEKIKAVLVTAPPWLRPRAGLTEAGDLADATAEFPRPETYLPVTASSSERNVA